jgi:hypothetical protein
MSGCFARLMADSRKNLSREWQSLDTCKRAQNEEPLSITVTWVSLSWASLLISHSFTGSCNDSTISGIHVS